MLPSCELWLIMDTRYIKLKTIQCSRCRFSTKAKNGKKSDSNSSKRCYTVFRSVWTCPSTQSKCSWIESRTFNLGDQGEIICCCSLAQVGEEGLWRAGFKRECEPEHGKREYFTCPAWHLSWLPRVSLPLFSHSIAGSCSQNWMFAAFCFRYSNVYQQLHSTISPADFTKDLKWWSNNHGVDMPMNWPNFEVILLSCLRPLWIELVPCSLREMDTPAVARMEKKRSPIWPFPWVHVCASVNIFAHLSNVRDIIWQNVLGPPPAE